MFITESGSAQASVAERPVALLLNRVPPKRVVITAFDSTDQAKAWYNSPAQQEINAMTEKALKERWYVVDSAM